MFDPVPATKKLRPAPTFEQLRQREEPVKIKSTEEFLKLIYVLNKIYGAEQTKDIEVTLKLKDKMPSENYKTRKDFLEQLRQTLLKEPPKKRRKKPTKTTERPTFPPRLTTPSLIHSPTKKLNPQKSKSTSPPPTRTKKPKS